jgi:hypothetical protein
MGYIFLGEGVKNIKMIFKLIHIILTSLLDISGATVFHHPIVASFAGSVAGLWWVSQSYCIERKIEKIPPGSSLGPCSV